MFTWHMFYLNLNLLCSSRIFGIFEKPLFLELCKHMETITLNNSQYLFRIGDPDENFYVVQSGRLNVYITESDGSTVSLKIVKAGDSIASLLSFADVLTVSELIALNVLEYVHVNV